MKHNFYQEIVFALDNYDDYPTMWRDISTQLQVLTRAGYLAKIYADDMQDDIIVVQFHFQDQETSEGECCWITWDEIEHLEMLKEPCHSVDTNS